MIRNPLSICRLVHAAPIQAPRHLWRTTRDSLNSRPLANGYTLLLRPDGLFFFTKSGNAPKQLESTPVIREVIPQWPQGLRYTKSWGTR